MRLHDDDNQTPFLTLDSISTRAADGGWIGIGVCSLVLVHVNQKAKSRIPHMETKCEYGALVLVHRGLARAMLGIRWHS